MTDDVAPRRKGLACGARKLIVNLRDRSPKIWFVHQQSFPEHRTCPLKPSLRRSSSFIRFVICYLSFVIAA